MKIGDVFSNEDKKTEINFENRKETKNMKNTTALFTLQKLYDICNEVEKDSEHMRICLDNSLIKKFEELEATEENIQFAEQLIRGKAAAVYAEYMELKKKGHFPQPHVAVITLHADNSDELATMSLKEETENFDGIRCYAEDCNSTEIQLTKSLIEMYYPDNVVIDGNTIVEYGMYKLPDTVNQLSISKLYMAQTGKECNFSVLDEEARPLFEQPVYQVPLKEDVIRWVRTKSESFIAEQSDSEEGRRNIVMAHERFEKFVATFNRRYDIRKHIELIFT